MNRTIRTPRRAATLIALALVGSTTTYGAAAGAAGLTARTEAVATEAATTASPLGTAATVVAKKPMVNVETRARAHISAFPAQTMHGADQAYELTDAVVETDGTEHVRFQRHYQGLRVIGGDIVVHSNANGALDHVSRTMDRVPTLSTQPTVAKATAASTAIAANPGYRASGKAELVVYARGDLPTLAYDVLLTGRQADGTPSEKHVIVDAHRHAVLDQWDDIHIVTAAGTGNGYFSGAIPLTTDLVNRVYYLRDPARGNQNTVNMANATSGGAVFSDADNRWGSGTLADTASVGVDIQYGMAVTWDYFKNVHKRNGIANNGVGAVGRAHYGVRYNNAFWSDACFCMTFGDGDGYTFNPFAALDVTGHEMAHGVTSRTARLVYSGESGGLNEATSDIFGTMVEFYAANAKDTADYYIGEKLFKSGTSAIRSMIQPSLDGVSSDCWYNGVGNLDVHYSSGVGNHFFFLLAQGTRAGVPSRTCVAGNTRVATGTGTVTGIGRAAAEKIWYRALTLYMTSTTTYAGARAATIRAASDLYGAGSVQANTVAAAWTAVGRL